MVSLKNISRFYAMGNSQVIALNDISFSLRKGDFVAVAGPSGAGKTTLMNIIGLIDQPDRGQVFLLDQSVEKLGDRQRTNIRRNSIGFIFQSFNLLPVLNVAENVEIPLLLGEKSSNKSERREWIEFLIEQVGLSDWINHKPSELSGGQRQRVAIARALAAKPALVIADEPTANLDSQTGASILELMKKINREQEATFLFSTHDSMIREMADHIIILKDGQIDSEELRSK